MDILSIDVETYCDLDIKDVGAYKYCEHPSFEILLFAYAFNDEPVEIVDFKNGEEWPQKVKTALLNPGIIKSAFNANFEINTLKRYLINGITAEDWQCTMVKALTMGLPGSLDMVGKAMHFEEDKQKMKEGKDLIKYFCKPCKPTKTNGQRARNLPEHAPDKWETFKLYCKQDVEVERDIRNKLSKYKTLDKEQQLWELDQHINDRGVGVDIELIKKAIKCDEQYQERLISEAKALTGLSNPNSPTQLKEWVGKRIGYAVGSINKDIMPTLIQDAETQGKDEVKRILELRQLMGKTSIKKYQTMQLARCNDGRVRGLLQFYGANRTGRWAGRLVQVQNLPQNHLPDLDDARKLLRNGDFEQIEFLYDSVSDTLSQLIRTAFIPREGNRFIVADFSAIEARVIAWIAGEEWRLEVFKTHGKIYEASASQMFHVPIESIKKGSDLRQKGKIAELALGYGGSVGALASMDKAKSIPEQELPELVQHWRNANPNITKFWWDCDKAAKKAIREKTTVTLHHGIKFRYDPGVLFIQLPSGRKLSYIRPKIEQHETFSGDKITYEGMEQTSKQWTRLDTYGPKLVENIVQAVARDCLAEAMFKVTAAGYDIVMHVHDEIIMDVPKDKGSVEEICNIFGESIEWAKGLPLRADGYECSYYMKD
ncbi:DNA polymerase [Clostridium beijerinckii]|uniref:DNA polymerase I n=1 Tax=Clostridium beijerinckii TaxID=1520 RepID=A0A9Q5GJH2_CLOBE|nr:DNA polymerase [Clostridium beijerinckii]AQS04766.1 DNA polymerase I [Clostridium beijerinckii]MBA2887557.1 DNA polymerase [Clostridium beijerinckii]MBA2902447.1 DNA polymerase [Clostridium beijerinckii]MBA2912263.1 DNA polymerase [Clostridium beijerinckii]MBA9015675.1 DNA polymerase [Clostridium beijerinckii]